jgi:hypothetical protein
LHEKNKRGNDLIIITCSANELSSKIDTLCGSYPDKFFLFYLADEKKWYFTGSVLARSGKCNGAKRCYVEEIASLKETYAVLKKLTPIKITYEFRQDLLQAFSASMSRPYESTLEVAKYFLDAESLKVEIPELTTAELTLFKTKAQHVRDLQRWCENQTTQLPSPSNSSNTQ